MSVGTYEVIGNRGNDDPSTQLTEWTEYSGVQAPTNDLQTGMYWQIQEGQYAGQWMLYGGNGVMGGSFSGYFRFDTKENLENWYGLERISAKVGVQNLTESANELKIANNETTLKKVLTIGPLSGETPGTKTERYPIDTSIGSDNDFVYFQFGKYLPPFSKDAQRKASSNTADLLPYGLASYNSSTQLEIQDVMNSKGIVLPMPQDLGNDLQQTWNGKQFSALGRAAIAGAAGGNFAELGARMKDLDGNAKAAIASLQTQILNKIPGVGGNIDLADITGSTEGIVLNPNAEILYDSPELREIGFTYKMIPRNSAEAKMIKKIVKMFRFASVPAFGGNENHKKFTFEDSQNDGNVVFEYGANKGQKFELLGKQNFMRVPYLCKFTFMTGSSVNLNVPQFKPCAIRKVGVNYTSDGTYATYRDGEPVATELTLNFLESKVLFKEDINRGF